MRSVCLFLLVAACGDSSHAQPDAAAVADASFDTGGSAAGPLDPTFATNGSAALPGHCQAIAVDANDRVITLTIDAASSANPPTLTRFDASGHVDASFKQTAIGIDAPPSFYHLFVLSSGKLVVTSVGSHTRAGHVYLLAADGTLDHEVDLPFGFAPYAGAFERDDGGIDIVDVGTTADVAFAFARINPAGAVDTAFGVKRPTTTGIRSGVGWSVVSLGHGVLALAGESSDLASTAPDIGNLMLATDGAITKMMSIKGTQFVSLAAHGGKLYALGTSYAAGVESLVRYDGTLAPDAGFTSPEAAIFTPTSGIPDGATLAVAPDGSVATTNGATLDRFRADGSARSRMPFAVPACDVVFDSQNRPLVGADTALLRLVQ